MTDLFTMRDAYTKLLSGENCGVNIHIPVTGEAFRQCTELNRTIAKEHRTPIVFGSTDFVFPHVTLKMGLVRGGKLPDVLQKLEAFTQDLSSMQIALCPVILKEPVNKYYFCEADDPRLIALSAALDELLAEEIIPGKFRLCKENLHHVTLGYKQDPATPAASVLGEKVVPFTANRIQVSVKGDYGVCLGVLKSYELK